MTVNIWRMSLVRCEGALAHRRWIQDQCAQLGDTEGVAYWQRDIDALEQRRAALLSFKNRGV